jgi:sporulation protein YlmC with PRC-barrel domain
MSAVGRQVELGLRLLDDQILDSEEHRCGRVDDIQLEGEPGTKTEIAALLTGSGAWTKRLRKPLADLIGGFAPAYVHCIPWSEVTRVGTAVRLAHTAEELGIEADDGRNVQWLGSLPRGTLLVSELLRSQVVTRSGHKVGRLWDIRVERQTELPDERVNEPWRVIGLVTGRGGWKERIGVSPEGEPTGGASFVPWASVEQFAGGVVTISDAHAG